MEPHQAGHQRGAARRGHEVRPVEVLDPRAAVGGPRASGARGEGAAVLPRHQGAAVSDARRQALRADPGLGPWRQDERLGPRQPALLRSRLQGRGEGRVGDPLADRIQGHQAVLRQSRSADRGLRWRRRLGLAAWQQVLHAAPRHALQRASAQEGLRGDEHPRRRRTTRQPDAAAQWLSRLSLLRELRRRLRRRRLILLGRPPAAGRHQDRQARDQVQCGRGAGPCRCQRPGKGRAVLRSRHRTGAPGPGEGRRDGRVGRGQHTHPAELEVAAAPQRHRQRFRRDRPLPVRADSRAHRRLSPELCTARRSCTTTAQAARTSICRASITG